MARIEIKDLPMDVLIRKEEMEATCGGSIIPRGSLDFSEPDGLYHPEHHYVRPLSHPIKYGLNKDMANKLSWWLGKW